MQELLVLECGTQENPFERGRSFTVFDTVNRPTFTVSVHLVVLLQCVCTTAHPEWFSILYFVFEFFLAIPQSCAPSVYGLV